MEDLTPVLRDDLDEIGIGKRNMEDLTPIVESRRNRIGKTEHARPDPGPSQPPEVFTPRNPPVNDAPTTFGGELDALTAT